MIPCKLVIYGETPPRCSCPILCVGHSGSAVCSTCRPTHRFPGCWKLTVGGLLSQPAGLWASKHSAQVLAATYAKAAACSSSIRRRVVTVPGGHHIAAPWNDPDGHALLFADLHNAAPFSSTGPIQRSLTTATTTNERRALFHQSATSSPLVSGHVSIGDAFTLIVSIRGSVGSQAFASPRWWKRMFEQSSPPRRLRFGHHWVWDWSVPCPANYFGHWEADNLAPTQYPFSRRTLAPGVFSAPPSEGWLRSIQRTRIKRRLSASWLPSTRGRAQGDAIISELIRVSLPASFAQVTIVLGLFHRVRQATREVRQ